MRGRPDGLLGRGQLNFAFLHRPPSTAAVSAGAGSTSEVPARGGSGARGPCRPPAAEEGEGVVGRDADEAEEEEGDDGGGADYDDDGGGHQAFSEGW
jgi:hypothetical protein